MEAGRMTFKIVCQVPDSETICPRCLARIAKYLDRHPEYRTDRTSLRFRKKTCRLSYRIRANEPVDFPNLIGRDYTSHQRKQIEDQHWWNESQGFAADSSDSRFGPRTLDYRAYYYIWVWHAEQMSWQKYSATEMAPLINLHAQLNLV